jgi:hypothetical protein
MKPLSSFETLTTTYHLRWHKTPEDLNLQLSLFQSRVAQPPNWPKHSPTTHFSYQYTSFLFQCSVHTADPLWHLHFQTSSIFVTNIFQKDIALCYLMNDGLILCFQQQSWVEEIINPDSLSLLQQGSPPTSEQGQLFCLYQLVWETTQILCPCQH